MTFGVLKTLPMSNEKDTKDKKSIEELEILMEERLKSIGIDIKKQLTLNDLASNFKKYFLRYFNFYNY